MEWSGFVPGLIGSLLIGVLLWLFLPRGVVLTRQHPVHNPFTGEILPDTWRITNESAVAARVTSVRVSSPALIRRERRSWWRRKIAGVFGPVARWFQPKEHGDPYPMWRRVGYGAAWWFVRREGPVFGVELPVEPDRRNSTATLTFDDETLEIVRTDRGVPWKYVTIPPGETLTAHVGVNTTLEIRYRRAGPFGTGERRAIVVHGYA